MKVITVYALLNDEFDARPDEPNHVCDANCQVLYGICIQRYPNFARMHKAIHIHQSVAVCPDCSWRQPCTVVTAISRKYPTGPIATHQDFDLT